MSKGRILYLSRLKALACFMIVFLHTITLSVESFKGEPALLKLLVSVRTLTIWAVPCFVMATGALLLDENRELGLKKLFSKLILRVVLALVIYTFLFKCFDALLIDKDFDLGQALDFTWVSILYSFCWKHMWYLYLLIAIYLMMPAYRAVTKNIDRKTILYLMGLMFVFLSLVPFVHELFRADLGSIIDSAVSSADYSENSSQELRIVIYVSKIFPLFLFAGYAVNKGLLKIPFTVALSGAVSCAGGTVLLLQWSILGDKPVLYKEIVSSYSFPLLVIGTVCLFSLFRNSKGKEIKVLDRLCAEIEKCSFGVFILHMAVLRYIFAVQGFNAYEHGGVLAVFGIAVGTFTVTVIVVRLLKFIPYVRALV
ncbi:MAG: acyltransferase family protein [Ruminococcus sp.]|nr:acyltransferase family protein [Ruminococcus sp.]